MNLGAQLTELRTAILRDFSTLVSGPTDSLWTDDQLVGYIADAERKFCRETFILRDADTPAYCQVTLQTGVSRYLLDPLVLAVISARWNTDTFDLRRIGRMLVAEVSPPDNAWFDPSLYAPLSPGRPTAFSTDELLVYQSKARAALVIYPAPSATENGTVLNLRVARNTSRTYNLFGADINGVSEISDDYVYDVLEWAAYRALRHHDTDAGDPSDAATHKTAFEDAVEKCKRDLRSKLWGQTQISFGENGFTWTR